MVLLLADALDIPLRARNEMLRAANHEARYSEPPLDLAISGYVDSALKTMLAQHNPFPMIIFDRSYNIVRANDAAQLLVHKFFAETSETNLLKLLFSEKGQAVIANWQDVAAESLRRIQRELLHDTNDPELQNLHQILVDTPNIPENWRQPQLNHLSRPLHSIRLNAANIRLCFLMTITKFDAPQNITLNDLRIESWYPLDRDTEEFCKTQASKVC